MQVLISDNVYGEKRHVNATPKGIDTHLSRDNIMSADAKHTVVANHIVYAEDIDAQGLLLGDLGTGPDQTDVGKGGAKTQHNKIHKNMGIAAGLHESSYSGRDTQCRTGLGARPRQQSSKVQSAKQLKRYTAINIVQGDNVHDLLEVQGGIIDNCINNIHNRHKKDLKLLAAKYLLNETIKDYDWPVLCERITMCFINLTSQTTYRGLITSIYLVCKEFGLVRHDKSFMLGLIACVSEFLDSSIMTQFRDIYSKAEISEIYNAYVTKNKNKKDGGDSEVDPDDIFAAFGVKEPELQEILKGPVADMLDVQSGTTVKIGIDMLINCIRNPRKLASIGLIKPVIRFIRALMGMGLMQYWTGSYNFQGVKLFALQPIEGGVFEIMNVVAESLQCFVDYGYAMIMEQTLFPKNFTFDKLQNLEFRVADLDAWMPFYENGRLEERGLQRADYIKRIVDAKAEITMLKKTNTDKMIDRTLVQLYCKLEKLHTRTAMVTLSSQLKYCPFGYLIAGPAGIGKSSVTSHMVKAFMSWKKQKQGWKPEGDEKDYVVTVNTADKFQSEVFSHHIVGLLDDFMNKKPEKVAPGENAHDLLIRIVNNVPCVALKPDVESKGAVPINFELVGLTTNVDHLYASLFVNDTYSILRRVQFVVYPHVRTMFRKEDSNALDPAKAAGHIDLWRFDVKYPMPKGGHRFYTFDDGREAHNIGLYELLQIYKREWEKHDDAQHEILSAQKRETPLCDCGFPKDICTLCSDYESPDDDFPEVFTTQAEDEQFIRDQEEAMHMENAKDARLARPRKLLSTKKKPWRKPLEVQAGDNSVDASTDIDEDVRTVLNDEDSFFDSLFSERCNNPNLVDSWIPSHCRGLEQHENLPWLADLIPEFIVRRLPNYAVLNIFTYNTLIYRRLLAHISFALICSSAILCLTHGFMIGLFAWLVGSFGAVFLLNQHSWMVSRYIIRRRERWSRFFALRCLPPAARSGLQFVAMGCLQGLACFAIFKVIKALFNKLEFAPEGGTYSIPNVKSNFAKLEITRAPGITPNHATIDQVKKLCEKSVGILSYSPSEGKRCYLNMVMFNDSLMMIPYHFLPETAVECELLFGSGQTIGHRVKCYLSRLDGYKIPGKDLLILYVSVIGDKPNISKFLPEVDVKCDQVCQYLYRDKDGELTSGQRNIRMQHQEICSIDRKTNIRYDSTGYRYTLDFDSHKGLCCMMFVANTKEPYIHSFHVAGGERQGGSNQLTRPEFEKARDFFKAKKSVLLSAHSGELKVDRLKSFKISEKPSDMSPLLKLGEETGFEYFGTIDTPVTRFTHTVHKTIICDSVCEKFGVKLNHKPPPPGKTWVHHLACIENTTNPNQGFDQSLVERSACDVLEAMGPTLKLLANGARPMSLDETVNGVIGIPGLEKMNRKTSAGFPYFKAKNKLCEIVDERMILPDEMIQEYERAKDIWKCGQRTYEVFHQSLKDEPIKNSKSVARTFQCSNMNLSLGLRQYYLPVLVVMLQRPEVFEMAVGCNAEGPEWEAIIKSISKYGEDRIVAGDYKNYDQKMSSQVLSAAFSIFIEFARSVGYTQEELEIMRTLATEVLFPVVHMNGDIFKLFGSMTSGNSLTTIGNCMCNSLLHRICYFGLAKKLNIEVPPFKTVSSLMTYGDDCADSVRPGFDWFNHTNRQEFFAKHNIVYTMAVKDQDSVPFINIYELSFLKRTPRYDEEMDAVLGPLDETSIFKSLQFITKSQLSALESAAVNMDNALAAWFFHGREKYEARSAIAFEILEDYDLIPYSRCYKMTYDDFRLLWMSRYRTGLPPIEIHPDPPGCKAQDGGVLDDYDEQYMRGLRKLLDACAHQVTLPVGVPLFRGDDSGQKVLLECFHYAE